MLLLNTSFYPSIGGVENSLRGLAESLIENGHDVDIIAGNLSTEGTYLPSSEKLFGANIHRYRSRGFLRRMLFCYFLCRKLKKEKNFILVLSRSNLTTLCARLAGFNDVKYLVPAVYRFQDSPSNKGKKGRYYIKYFVNCFLEICVFYGLKKVYVFSQSMIEQVRIIKPSLDVLKVFPGVDSKRFQPVDVSEKKKVRKNLGLPDEKKVLLCMGRLEKVKGFDLAIETMKFLPDSYYLVIVGEGSQKQYLESLTKKWHVSHKVTFVGFTNEPEAYYKASDFFLMTSIYEPLGQVILEAVASGLTVVAPQSTKEVDTATSEIADKLDAPIIQCEMYNSRAMSDAILSISDADFQNITEHHLDWMSLYEQLVQH